MAMAPVVVVKIGGSAGVNFEAVCDDAARLVGQGQKLVLVHGGSDATNTLSEQLGHPAKFLTSPSGHTSRRTDRRTLEIFQMACGLLNQRMVELLQARGVNALGLSGMDGKLWRGERKKAVRAIEDGRTVLIRDDYTGSVEQVNTDLIRRVIDAGYTPVLSPPAISYENEPINIDADRAAAKTASALGAATLLLLSNVKGLYRAFPDESTLIERVNKHEIERYAEFAQGRMKKKVLGAGEALEGGVGRVIIGDARAGSPITDALAGAGTVIS